MASKHPIKNKVKPKATPLSLPIFESTGVSSDSVFIDDFWVNKGCMSWWIHASTMKAISLIIFESAATQFSLTIYETTGAVSADESMRQPWKPFCWQFLSRQRLSFRWWFLSQQGLCAPMNPSVSHGSSFIDIFELVATQFSLTISESIRVVCADESMRQPWKQFRWWFLSWQRLSFYWRFMRQQGLCPLTNPCTSHGSSFVDNFWVDNDSVFVDDF